MNTLTSLPLRDSPDPTTARFRLALLSEGDLVCTTDLDAQTLDEAEREVREPDRDGDLPYHTTFEILDDDGETLSEYVSGWERTALGRRLTMAE